MDRKRGSHVGFVISFVIFITFVVFMYIILNSRVDFGQEKTNSLDYVKGELTERISGNLTSISVAITNQGPNCAELKNFLSTTGIGNRLIVRSDTGVILNAGITGNNLQVQKNGNTFFRVYNSEEFSQENDSLTGCQPLNPGTGYTIGLARDSKEIFESKVLRLLNNYTADYETLKKDMGVISKDDFGFRFVYNNGTEIRTPEKNLVISVYIDRTPIQYIKRDGTMESGFLDSIVW